MKFILMAVAAVIVLLVVGAIVLGSVDIPAPSGTIEKTVPTDQPAH